MITRLTLAEIGKRAFEVVSKGVCYRYSADGAGLVFIFDRLRWKWDELHCELAVTTPLRGAQTVNGDSISRASFNISSDRARTERANRITTAGWLKEIPVDRLLEEACQQVLDAERSASASISLHDVPDEDTLAPHVSVDGIAINLTETSMFFGLPGSGKSLAAERFALELVREGRRVGYVDFEWGPGPHRKRAQQLYGPSFPDVRYLRLERPLIQEIDGLRRTVVMEGWDYAVIDSVSFGVSGPPESAEVASAFLQACRQLRIGLVLVAHQTKAEGGDKYPFGSVLWYAGARSIYHFRRASSEQASGVCVSAVTHRKANAGPLRPSIAIEYAFTADHIAVRQVNPAAIEDIAATLPIRQRLAYALRSGPRDVESLAEELGTKVNSINQALSRDEQYARQPGKVRQFIRLPGPEAKVALYAQGQ